MKKLFLILPLLALAGCKGRTNTPNALVNLPATQTLYVSSSAGSDSNPGTQAAPVKTNAHAMTLMHQGDTLLLNGTDTWTGDCIKINADNQTIGVYGAGTPVVTGCAHGVDIEGFNGWTVGAIRITGVSGEGIYAVATTEGTNLNGTINGTAIDNTGWSGILVRNRSTLPVTGLKITNAKVGTINVAPHLDYSLAGIQLNGVSGAVVSGGAINTGTQMGLQDRSYGSAACGKNTFTKLNVYGDEGGITAVCDSDQVLYSHVHNGKGFGVQVGPNGLVYQTQINDLVASTGGNLYNGIDGKGSTNAVFSGVTISNVAKCSITAEGVAPYAGSGIKVQGGTIDATAGGQCAVYTSSAANKITFDGKTVWKTLPNVKAFHIGGLANADMMTQATFTTKALQ